jgi:broad specificity phosphatase PhoE
MKITVVFLTAFFVFLLSGSVSAQDVTLILLRHAEKDLSVGVMDKTDPELSAEGRQRAERLVETLKKYKPTQIYSTGYKRTRATVTPLAENIVPGYRRQIQFYDHNRLEEFAAELLKSRGTIVVVGHNTTTPTLANLLVKSEKYKYLQDNEYDKIWIIRIRKNKIRDVVITY